MPNWIVADDSSSAIAYGGSWSRLVGSTRQWDGAVHSTSQVGATATFRFRGSGIQVYGTIPIGPGKARSRYTIDGGAPTTVERQSRPEAEYNNLLFEQRGMREGEHTLVITNIGTDADLQLDKIEWYPLDDPSSETPLPPIAPQPVEPTSKPPTSPDPPRPSPTTNPNDPPPGNDDNNGGGSNNNDGNNNTSNPGSGNNSNNNGNNSGNDNGNATTDPPTPNSTSNTSNQNSSPTTTPRSPESGPDASSPQVTTTPLTNTTQPFNGVVPGNLSEGDHTVSGSDGETGTLVVKVSDGVTHTVTEKGPGETGVGAVGATSSGVSKGALAGIIVASILVMFMFILLACLLLRRYRNRRALLSAEAAVIGSDKGYGGAGQTRERRNEHLSPFDVAARRTSEFFTGLGASKHTDASRAPFSRLAEVHKPPLNTVGTHAYPDAMPYSPSDLSSPSTYTSHSTTFMGSDAAYLFQNSAGPSNNLHRRRNLSSDVDSETMGTWGVSAEGMRGDVPPPSYQASFGHSGGSSEEASTFMTANAVASSSTPRDIKL